MKWFDVDVDGLSATLERRGKSFAVFELVQNAWDSGATAVDISLQPVSGKPFVEIVVKDNSAEGWSDLADAFTLFSKSRRSADAEKRGRFCFGEKMVLSLCTTARISTMQGSLVFDKSGRTRVQKKTDVGTEFSGVMRMTREEFDSVCDEVQYLISPQDVRTTFNDRILQQPSLLKSVQVKLPTEVADMEGVLRRSVRQTTVYIYAGDDSENGGQILELGIPVCSADFPFRVDVQQKIPLGMDRDSVTDAFRRAVSVAVMNAMAGSLTESQAADPWASEAIADARAEQGAVTEIIKKRFGERAVIATPGDPVANASAEANGCEVIHGGALSAGAWANVRKYQVIPTTSQAFPTPKPAFNGAGGDGAVTTCPLCKQPVR